MTKSDVYWARKKNELSHLAERMRANLADLRRPLVIELAGTPKAGKSLTINALAKFFRRHQIPVSVVIERASVCPIVNKNHPFFNVWTSCTSLAQMLEGLERNASVVILDRGLFDAVVWMNLHRKRTNLSQAEFDKIIEFLLLDPWRKLIDVIAALSVEPSASLEREYKDQLIDKEGSIMNIRSLGEYNESFAECLKRYGTQFQRMIHIDTTKTEPLQGVTEIASKILEAADQLLDEEIAVIDRSVLQRFMPAAGVITAPEEIQAFLATIARKIKWMRRTAAERTLSVVQPIPAAVIQDEDRILVANVRGAEHGTLQGTHSIWLGGHIRKSDTEGGGSFREIARRCVSRELYEEIQLRIEPRTLPEAPSAIVWDDTKERSIQHFGLLYVCSDDQVHDLFYLHQREFWESQAKSLFTQVLSMGEQLTGLPNWERWSMMYLAAAHNIKFPRDVRQRLMF